MSDYGWITSNPEVAALLRAADEAYEKSVTASSGLPLAEKLTAIRVARETRASAYEAVLNRCGIRVTHSPKLSA